MTLYLLEYSDCGKMSSKKMDGGASAAIVADLGSGKVTIHPMINPIKCRVEVALSLSSIRSCIRAGQMGDVLEGGMTMLLLWAMSLWGAAIVLMATGYGAREFKKYGLESLTLIAMASMVWVLGWWTASTGLSGIRINLGLLLLFTFALGLNVFCGNLRWWYTTLLLAVLGAIIRLYAPVATHQAEVMPVATIEAVGLGMAAAIGLGEAFPGAVVASSAEGVTALIIAGYHPLKHDLGRYDIAMLIICALSAWVVGWAFFSIKRRFQRFA